MLRRTVSLFLLAAAAAACADGSAPTALSAPPATSGAELRVQELARAVAVAMGNPQVRADVRDAMRASTLTQHRVPFRAFLASASGERFTAAVANALATSPAGVRAMAAELPDLDFFVPERAERRTWEATAAYVVTGLVQRPQDGTATAFTPNGRAVQIQLGLRYPGGAVLQLTPTEHRDERIDPQPRVPGKVIEDEDDGTLSGTFTWTPAGGTPVTVQLAELKQNGHAIQPLTAIQEPCEDAETALVECSGGGGGGGGGYTPPPADTTFLDYYRVFFYDGYGCGDPDPSFIATYYNASGVAAGTGQLNYSEVNRDRDFYPHHTLILRRVVEGSGERINVKVVERDSGWCGGDDNKGNRDFYSTDRAQIRSIYSGSTATANVELDWTPKY